MKRFLKIFLLLFLLGAPAAVEAALVQSNSVDGSTTLAFPSNTTAGNLIVLVARVGTAGSTPTVGDTSGNTYTLVTKRSQAFVGELFFYYAKNIAGGANTATFDPGPNTNRWAILEYSGLDTVAPLDQFAANSNAFGSGTTISSGNVITTAANEILIAAGTTNSGHTWTAGAGYTLQVNVNGANQTWTEDQSVSTTGTYAGVFTLDSQDDWIVILATFKAAGGAAAPPMRSLLGVGQ